MRNRLSRCCSLYIFLSLSYSSSWHLVCNKYSSGFLILLQCAFPLLQLTKYFNFIHLNIQIKLLTGRYKCIQYHWLDEVVVYCCWCSCHYAALCVVGAFFTVMLLFELQFVPVVYVREIVCSKLCGFYLNAVFTFVYYASIDFVCLRALFSVYKF